MLPTSSPSGLVYVSVTAELSADSTTADAENTRLWKPLGPPVAQQK